MDADTGLMLLLGSIVAIQLLIVYLLLTRLPKRHPFPFPVATGFIISQLTNGGKRMGNIQGIQPGQSANFSAATLPGGGQLQSGNQPAWTADDPAVVITVLPTTPDGVLHANVAVPAGDTNASFNLTLTGVNSDGVGISSSVGVPIIPVTPPVIPATGFDISQDGPSSAPETSAPASGRSVGR